MRKSKNRILGGILMLTLVSLSCQAQKESQELEALIGVWKLDMTPQDDTDDNFAKMIIEKIEGDVMEGDFYQKGVPMRKGRINVQKGIIYGACISGDKSGNYNTSFYWKEGLLYGTTHALERDFLAVWTATKE